MSSYLPSNLDILKYYIFQKIKFLKIASNFVLISGLRLFLSLFECVNVLKSDLLITPNHVSERQNFFSGKRAYIRSDFYVRTCAQTDAPHVSRRSLGVFRLRCSNSNLLIVMTFT